MLDGAFGAVELKLGSTGATALAEASGSQHHAGLRYYSDPLPWLWSSQLVGTVQRSFGATTPAGASADASSFNVSWVVPLGTPDKTRQTRADADAAANPLPALAPPDAPAAGGMVATAQDRLDTLARALRATGLDRVRVGLLGDVLVVDYENYRYLHNEADGLGVVLGLTRRSHLRARRGCMPSRASWGWRCWRPRSRWWRTSASCAMAMPGRSAPAWALARCRATAKTRCSGPPARRARAHAPPGCACSCSRCSTLRWAPSLARSTIRWRRSCAPRCPFPGAEVYVDGVQRLASSDNMAPGRIFASSRQTNGLMTAALQQSLWLGPRVFASVGAGQYNHDYLGAEGVSILYLPWNGDTVHLKGSYLRNQADVLPRVVEAYAGAYRWQFNPQTWVEAGYQQYTDYSTGPSVALTRWFGDVAVQLFARKGGNNTFVGLELSLPLTPRQGMGAEVVQLTGTPRYAQSIRTRLTNSSNALNYVDNAAVRSVSGNLAYKPEVELLNSGRITPADIRSQVQRMRESFYLYGRDQIKPSS